MIKTSNSPFRKLPPLASILLASATLFGIAALPGTAAAQSAAPAPAAPTVRIRGTVVYADQKQVIVKDRSG